MPNRLPPVALLLTAVWLGACGGDDGPTKAEYVKAADAVCARASTQATPVLEKLAAVNPMTLDASSARRLAEPVQRLQAIGAGLVTDLRALEQPEDGREAIEAFIGSTSTLVDALGRAAQSLAGGDSTGALAALSSLGPAGQEVKTSADAYGLKRCGTVVNLP